MGNINSLKNILNNYKLYIVSIILVLISITVGVYMLNSDTKQYDNAIGNKEYILIDNIGTQIEDNEVRSTIEAHIINGDTGIFKIDNTNYAIITTNSESASDIEYSIQNVNGKIIINWWLSDETDSEFITRTKVIQINSDDVELRKRDAVNNTVESEITGISNFIVFRDGEDKLLYNCMSGRLISDVNTLELEGLYLGYIKDNIFYSKQQLNSVGIEIEALKEIEASNGLYEVRLDNRIIHIRFQNKPVLNEKINVELQYNKSENTFVVQ